MNILFYFVLSASLLCLPALIETIETIETSSNAEQFFCIEKGGMCFVDLLLFGIFNFFFFFFS